MHHSSHCLKRKETTPSDVNGQSTCFIIQLSLCAPLAFQAEPLFPVMLDRWATWKNHFCILVMDFTFLLSGAWSKVNSMNMWTNGNNHRSLAFLQMI